MKKLCRCRLCEKSFDLERLTGLKLMDQPENSFRCPMCGEGRKDEIEEFEGNPEDFDDIIFSAAIE